MDTRVEAVSFLCVDVDSREERLVERAAGVVVGELVELLRAGEQVERGEECGAACVEVGALGLVELPLQAGSVVADAA